MFLQFISTGSVRFCEVLFTLGTEVLWGSVKTVFHFFTKYYHEAERGLKRASSGVNVHLLLWFGSRFFSFVGEFIAREIWWPFCKSGPVKGEKSCLCFGMGDVWASMNDGFTGTNLSLERVSATWVWSFTKAVYTLYRPQIAENFPGAKPLDPATCNALCVASGDALRANLLDT